MIKNKMGPGTSREMWNALASVLDFDRIMPRLECAEFEIYDIGPNRPERSVLEWPCLDDDARSCMQNSCSSLRQLVLDIEESEIRFDVIKSLFPNVTCLELRRKMSISKTTWTTPPLAPVLQSWPNLAKFKMTFLGDKKVAKKTIEVDVSKRVK